MLKHVPVLLEEAVSALCIQADGYYIDATFGRGGHSQAILAQLGQKGRLFAFDKDPEAATLGKSAAFQDQRFTFVEGSFTTMLEVMHQAGLTGKIDGILIDLGVSSPQLDTPMRGFSFQSEGPLDMRMNPQEGKSLAEWLVKAPTEEIAWVLKHYGEERFAKRIAIAIKHALETSEKPLSTKTLAELIAETIPHEKKKHPATRSFLAFRVFINDELNELKTMLSQCASILKTKGRLVVISFHSLEDRIVKHFIRPTDHPDQFLPKMVAGRLAIDSPFRPCSKAIKASVQECHINPRARSAIMRIAEKVL